MEADDLHGCWELTRSAEGHGPHTLELTATGDLIYSFSQAKTFSRVLLTYRVDGYALVVDQPSAPREERVAAVLTLDDTLVIGEGATEARYRRAPLRDAEARPMALAGRALRHAISGVPAGAAAGVFTPLLWWDEGAQPHARRILAATPEAAARQARAIAADLPPAVTACAYVYDGYLTADGERSEAGFCDASRRAPTQGVTMALRYRVGPQGGQAVGPLVRYGEIASWLAA